MRQDIREMSYVFQKEKQDKELLYVIDLLLYKEFENRFTRELDFNFTPTYLDNIYLETLKDRDGIITNLIETNYVGQYFGKVFVNDDYKLYYLIDTEFMKQLEKCKKYYDKRLKTRNKVKDDELYTQLITYFKYCFNESSSVNNAQNKIKLMSTSDFRKATIDDLKIKVNDYLDFDKIYNKAFNDFKKIYKNDLDTTDDKGDKIGFGWRLYAGVKGIETLFKL